MLGYCFPQPVAPVEQPEPVLADWASLARANGGAWALPLKCLSSHCGEAARRSVMLVLVTAAAAAAAAAACKEEVAVVACEEVVVVACASAVERELQTRHVACPSAASWPPHHGHHCDLVCYCGRR